MVDNKDTSMGEYPYCEVKVAYDCHLCKDKHTAVVKAKKSMDVDARRGYLEMAKRDCVFEFFRQHKEAEAKSFDLNKLTGLEVLCYAEDEVEREEIGVPMIKEDVIAWRKELFGEIVAEEIKEPEEEEGTALSIERAEELAPIETGIKKGMDFGEVEAMVKERLLELLKKEERLLAELILVQNEKKQFKELVDATKKAREIRGLNKEEKE